MTNDIYAHIPNRRDIIDRRVLADRLAEIASGEAGIKDGRTACVAILKAAMEHGRLELLNRLRTTGARGPLITGGFSFLIDQIVRLAFDFTTTVLFPKNNPTSSERLVLLAVGGYGRAELAPFSDIDIHFITPYKQTPWGEQVIETLLYILWDLKLKIGHAVRSLVDMVRLAKEDLTICTSLLEARYLWGDQSLYDEARTLFRKSVVSGTAENFVQGKLKEREARHKRMGDSRYVVEPNLKEGKGGLRDLHTLFWIGKYLHAVDSAEELVDKGLFSREEYKNFAKAEDFLWTVRCHLHDISGRAEERLSFNVQPELAKRLKYTDRPGMSGVERFMKHYFLAAKQVGDLTRVFLAHVSQQTRKKPLFRLPAIAKRLRKVEGFIVDGGQLSINDLRFFKQAPIRLLKLFQVADEHGLDIHPTAMRQASADAGLINADLRHDPEANQLFLDVLTSRKNSEVVLRWMSETGVFGRFIPDFGRVVAQMQYDMYHHYTVDEHSIRAIGLLAKIERGDLTAEHPLAHAIMQKIVSRRVLYVAVLLHDIAKGRRGDHSILGADVANKLCPRLGLTAAETETVSWLVRYHLILSDTAFKRDLTDYKTILDFAERVQSPERLKLLLALTTVDIRAVGPNVWNSWKGQLLRELYEATEELLLAGHKESGRSQRLQNQQAQLATTLDWQEKRFSIYAKRFFDSYWIAESPDVLHSNAKAVGIADAAKKTLSITLDTESQTGATLLSVYAADHPGLFSRVSGAIALAGANILGAKIHTTRDGMALDNFTIEDSLGIGYQDEGRKHRLIKAIEDTLSGTIKLVDRLEAKQAQSSKASSFKIEPVVLIDSKASNRYTVVEINALDRPALLYALTGALFQSRLTIHSAHIATYGERAVDVFYITDLTNDKITNSTRLKTLERRLLSAASGDVETPEKTKVTSIAA